MLNEFAFQIEIQHYERELAVRNERRRLAADRPADEVRGSRLAALAHRARLGRAMGAQPGC